MTAEGKAHGAAQRTAPGRGGCPQGRRTFGPVKSSTALLSRKVAKAQMFVYSAARKGKRMERLSLKAEETYGSIHVSFRRRG